MIPRHEQLSHHYHWVALMKTFWDNENRCAIQDKIVGDHPS